MCEGSSAGTVGSIGSRQRALEVTLEAVPQIGLQLYIAAKKNAIGGLQVSILHRFDIVFFPVPSPQFLHLNLTFTSLNLNQPWMNPIGHHTASFLLFQLFTLLTSTVGGVFTVVYALDDLVASPLRRNLFDCSNVFRPALAIGAAFWSILVHIHIFVDVITL